jgi:hypothetical protein
MFVRTLASLALVFGTALAAYPGPGGRLTSPANGTVVTPGQPFPFTYNYHSDYSQCSQNITVWALTAQPGTSLPAGADPSEVGHPLYPFLCWHSS